MEEFFPETFFFSSSESFSFAMKAVMKFFDNLSRRKNDK